MSGKACDQVKPDEDNRAFWERPAFRRLAASMAESGVNFGDDGNCNGGSGQPNHHSCPPG
jgi:hypothetical protein